MDKFEVGLVSSLSIVLILILVVEYAPFSPFSPFEGVWEAVGIHEKSEVYVLIVATTTQFRTMTGLNGLIKCIRLVDTSPKKTLERNSRKAWRIIKMSHFLCWMNTGE